MADQNPDFYLDTGNMDSIIGQVQELAGKLERIRAEFTTQITKTTEGWSGKARTMFDKKAHQLAQQLTDVSQSLYDISDSLLSASEAYMEVDTQLAKKEDGVTNRY